MATNSSHLDIIYNALEELGHLSIYELLSGSLSDYNITYPAFYITNITNSSVDAALIQQTIENYVPILENTIFTKDPFVGGVVAFCFVLCGIVTATWMFMMLLMFSSNSVPNSLLLVTLYSCCQYTVIVSRLTGILKYQISSNFTNIDEINNLITFSKDIVIVRCILFLLNCVCWVDLVVQMNKFHNRQKALIIGLSLTIVTFSFFITYNILRIDLNVEERSNSKAYQGFKYGHWILNYLLLVLFTLEILIYAKERLRIVIHRKTLPLTIFCAITMICPFVFHSVDISSRLLKNWANYAFEFSELCCSIVVWEWLHAVRALEIKYEKKTIIGRRIFNDSFARGSKYTPFGIKRDKASSTVGIQGANNSSVTVNHSYILNSTNFLSFIDILGKIKYWFSSLIKIYILKRPTETKRGKTADDVSLFEMSTLHPQITNISNISQVATDDDDISYIENNHPQFEVDHRYLRNTPSTAYDSARNTPNVPMNDGNIVDTGETQ